MSVQEGCKKILVSDYFNLQKKLVTTQQKGICVNDEIVCGACHGTLIKKGIYKKFIHVQIVKFYLFVLQTIQDFLIY